MKIGLSALLLGSHASPLHAHASCLSSSATISRSRTGDTTGFKFFEVDELERLMRDAGFADVEVRRLVYRLRDFPILELSADALVGRDRTPSSCVFFPPVSRCPTQSLVCSCPRDAFVAVDKARIVEEGHRAVLGADLCLSSQLFASHVRRKSGSMLRPGVAHGNGT